MATAVAMPKLGMTMQEGRVVSWAAEVGGTVERGRVLLVIESEKAEIEIEATASGVLRHVYVPEGETVPCGALLAAITGTVDEPFDAAAFAREHGPRSGPAARARAVEPAPRVARPAADGGGAPAVTPAARVLAKKLGLDPGRIPGTGPGGRITKEDVEAWAARRAALVEVAPGVALEVPTQGAGEPVLLLPGFGTDVSAFARQIPLLASRYRVLGVNPRGVGGSDAPEAECYEVATSAADAAAASPEPAHVIGASLGAAVAIEFALARPERVRSLVLVTPFLAAGPLLLAVIDAWCRVAAEASPATLARMLMPWLFSSALLADMERRERTARGLAEMAARIPAPTLTRAAAGLRAWSGTRATALTTLTVPTLVISAERDLLVEDAAAVAAAIPGAGRVVVPGAGHAVALEDPEAVTTPIVRFLERSAAS